MSNFDPEMKGTLGENLYRRNERDSDMKGKCQINGIEYNISGWLKTSKNGGQFYSLSFTERTREKVEQGSKIIASPAPRNDFRDEEVPF